jgi:hypothetical protein
MKKLIIRLNDSNSLQISQEGLKLNKLTSSISPLNFIKLLRLADNKVNPRIAKSNRITKSIIETLQNSPDLFWLKSKGVLLATESCRILDRNRIEVSLENKDFEGIMDGGHNTLAIATFIIETLFEEKIKSWDECKNFWDANYEEILIQYEKKSADFKFSIPIEIIFPNDEDGSDDQYYETISEICSARNNNVQLSETAKGNQLGSYDYLKELLGDQFDVIWKAGETGKIKSEDVISLATIPLIYLNSQNLLPEDIKVLNKISVYSQKSKCVDYFNLLMSHNEISNEVNGKYELENKFVKSALDMTEDILKFFDRIFLEFPKLYHKASPGKFGRISSVTMKESKVPYFSLDEKSEYQYSLGFIYPLISGLTSLMEVDQTNQIIKWRVNPNEMDLQKLDLTQYVNIIKLVNFDPQKIGKGEVFYKEAEVAFSKI